MKLLIRIAAATAAIAIAGPALAAGPSCRYASDIAALADIPLIHPDQYGSSNSIRPAEFAYLKIKYGALGQTKALDLFTSLSKQRAFDEFSAEELRLSIVSADERMAFLHAPDSPNRKLLLTTSATLVRALIKDGHLDAYLTAVQDELAKPDRNDKITGLIILAAISLADEQKNIVAQRFADWNVPSAAALILASKVDPSNWMAFRKAHPIRDLAPDNFFQAFVADSGPSMRREGLGGLEKILPVPPPKDEMDAYERAKSEIRRIDPLGGWLRLLAVQEFKAAPLTELFNQIDKGDVDPHNSDDLAIAAVKELDRSWDKATREQKIARSPIPLPILSLSTNEFPATLYFDSAIAREALLPLIRDQTSPAPARPESLSSAFPWDDWVDVARSLAAGKPRPDKPYVSVELLQAAGRNAEAAALLTTAGERPEEYPIAVAYATKLLVPLLKTCDDETNLGDFTFVAVYRFGDP